MVDYVVYKSRVFTVENEIYFFTGFKEAETFRKTKEKETGIDWALAVQLDFDDWKDRLLAWIKSKLFLNKTP